MNETAINWDSIPDIITKDQLYQICHISKSTALYLLRSGKIPCEYTGKKTRCYKIKKADVITYLEKRKVFPESYSAPAGWYKGNYTVKMSADVPEQVLENMRLYYTEFFAQYPDVLTATEISKVIGYGTTSINDWCRKGHIKAFKRNNMNHIPMNDCTPSHAQSIRLKKMSQDGLLTADAIYAILSEEKPNQKEQIKLPRDELRKYFPQNYSDEQIKRDILKGLELLKRQRERNRDAR